MESNHAHPLTTPSPVSRRGARWDLFDCDGHGTLEIQRIDVPAVDGVEPFADDQEAAGFVLCMAQWTANPDRALRDECRAALIRLAQSWPAGAPAGHGHP